MPAALIVLAAAWWVFHVEQLRGRLIPSYDIYAAFYPNVEYALRSLHAGYGLLWNPLQNCGQPFLPATLLGPFYPLNAVFPLFGLERGIPLIAFVHLAIAGVGTYLLCREIGLGRAAAVCGGIAFELSRPLIQLAGWLPATILGSFVWLPVALLCCERLLRAPGLRAGLWLGLVLTLSLLAAYPQMTMFIYQIVLLRVGWEVATGRWRGVVRAAVPLALALALPLGLGAGYLAPATEFVAQSVRDRRLHLDELAPASSMITVAALRQAFAGRNWNFWPGSIAFAALAPLGFAHAATRRQAGFYALAAVLFTALAVDGPLLRFYLSLPIGSNFRLPSRFIWVATFAAFMLAALGAEALARATTRRFLLPVLIVLGAWAILLWTDTRPQTPEAWTVGGLVGVAVLLAVLPVSHRLRWVVVAAIPLVVGASAIDVSRFMWFTYTDGQALLDGDAGAFAILRARMTPQDRFYAVAGNTRYGLTEKSASVFGVASISDYEPQTSRRFAELNVMLRTNTIMQSINDYGFKFTHVPRNRRVLDLLATRYLLVESAGEPLPPEVRGWLRPLGEVAGVAIYENPEAFPRAFFAATARVEPDPVHRLEILGSGDVDLRHTVLLEDTPPGGLPAPTDADGTASIEEDRSEVVRLRVHAGAAGFVVLSDQDYPGWTATVNGVARPVLRADHAFRAVAVPAGDSTVVFAYRPTRLWIGVGVSLATLALVLGLFWRAPR